jgi:hypothetical protein
MQLVPARLGATILVTAAFGLVLAGSASASVATAVVTATPSTTLAGEHPDLGITTDLTYDTPLDSAQDVTLHLGPGLIGSPAAAASCSQATFAADGVCPVGSQIGTTALSVIAFVPAPTPLTAPGEVYNLDVPVGDTTHLAFLGLRVHTLAGDLNEVSPVTTSPVDLGFDSQLSGLPNMLGPAPIQITRIALTLDGAIPGRDAFFMTNPTQCRDAANVVVTVNSHGAPATQRSGSDGYLATDCAHEPFSGGGLLTRLDTTRTDTPAQIGVTVTQPGEPKPSDAVTRHNAHVLQSTTVLPQGVTINPALADGLVACTDAQFGQGDAASAAGCPAGSLIGSVSFVAPVVGKTLEGPVYLGRPTPADADRLFVDVPVPGAHLKLLGHVHLDPSSGQVTTVFDDLPQIPFTAFDLTFKGGSHSVLSTPATCGAHTATSELVPFSRLTGVTPPNDAASTSFTTSFDGAGAPCVQAFRPYFFTRLGNTRAGGSGSFTLRFARPDRDGAIGKVAFSLPAGLVGDLALKGLTQCPLATAAKTGCGPSSRLGSIAVQVGPGPTPPTLPGTVFLTAPRVKGDPGALSILIPATLGPVDLGNVIVGVRLQLRSNGGLTATSDPLPQFQGGVPLAIRSATITLDRPGFMRNPTQCGRLRSSGRYDAVGGSSATSFAALTLTDCTRLGFRPHISATLGAKGATAARSHPPLTTVVTQGSGQAGLRRVHVTFPLAVSTNLRAINAACQPAALAAGTCSSKARVGTASATSPLVSRTLRGSVYLVSRGAGKLPKLVVQLRGPLAIDLDGIVTVGQGGHVAATFRPPDLPIARFALALHGGSYGALAAARSLCTTALPFRTSFMGQNGKRVSQRSAMTVRGCR